MKIEELGLQADVEATARHLLALFPMIVFTSGRRSREDQSRAMAQNVVSNRRWIERTYKSTGISRACQLWIDKPPQANTVEELQEGILQVLNLYSDNALTALSKHFSGRAFDIQPVLGASGEQIKQEIRRLPHLQKFLDHEGGLVRWHLDF